ncbi:MAG: hypothetical protein COW72_01850 [Candidatus Nealsonbacteria bacterium CG18_big_fil_WC_8_21_14_2_50_37_10]|uniref:histidine kinase n=1 Tax=Candidatus Nealsonbacteria bacterium CG18_big_fil_WC_8_21_14_2_50_37_10 TaxID=1974717 RepID=A0A2H0FL18_9BACT|nr:MAG: hypothetical protein COW72_01850 [Candidatus Nealsonbacteria bacterium CG18_big_fil_WC_8_21_14_2_50_37_10]
MEIDKNKNEDKISILLEDLDSLKSYIEDLFSFLPLPVCFISPIGVILETNPAFEKISGYKIDEIIGKSIEDIFAKEKTKEIFKEAEEKGSVSAREISVFTKEKKEIPVSLSIIVRKSKEGEISGYFIGLFDLTDIKTYQKNLEEEAKDLQDSRSALINILEDVEEARKSAEEEENKTLAIITNFADGLLVFNKEGRLFLINPQAEDFFDVKSRDIVGRPILELATFPTIEPVVGLIGGEIKGVFRKEVQIKENLILEVSTVSMMREEEKFGTLIILHDVSREKMIERMKTEFVSLSAHQLRTPLSAIKWTLKMLLDGDLGKITGEQRDFIEKTYKSNERMINLINDLLDVSRIEEGRYLYKPILTNLESVIQFVVNSYKEEIERKKLKFEFKKPEKKLPEVRVDVEKIKLAIDNLLGNAIRYTLAGGEVTVSLKCVKKEIELSVKDTGVGIPKDQQGRVFTKFFRAANAIRMETEGSGLGLFIAKNIIEAHGGKIWFESEENQGTTFHFSLPVKEKFKEFLKEF